METVNDMCEGCRQAFRLYSKGLSDVDAEYQHKVGSICLICMKVWKFDKNER